MPSEPAPPEPRSGEFYLPWLLGVCAILSLAFGLVSAFAPVAPLTVPLGLFVLLFAPGYALGSLLFPKPSRLHWTASFGICVGLSVLFNAAIGLGLLVASMGLPPVIFAIAAVTVDAVAWLVRRLSYSGATAPAAPRPARLIPAALSLPSYSKGQRTAAYVLMLGIAVVVAIIIYLAAVTPASNGQVSLATPSPPAFAILNSTVNLTVEVGNNATTQRFTLGLTAMSGPSTIIIVVPWGTPIVLGPNTASYLNFTLTSRATTTFDLELEFKLAAKYVMTVELDNSAGAVLRTNTFGLSVS